MRVKSVRRILLFAIVPMGAVVGATSAGVSAETTMTIEPASIASVQEVTESGRLTVESKSFRREFGLDVSDAQIGRAISDLSASEGSVTLEYGVPLFKPEVAALHHRDRVIAATKAVLPDVFIEDPENFAGHYFDHQNGASFVIMVKKSSADVEKHVLSSVPYPAETRLRVVKYSLEELDLIATDIILNQDVLAGSGVRVVESDGDWRTNQVRLTVEGDPAIAQKILSPSFPPGLLSITGSPGLGGLQGSLRPDAPPWRAGQAIRNFDSGLLCTTSFVGANGSGNDTKNWVLTAGHCGLDGHTVDQGSSTYGYAWLFPTISNSQLVPRADAAAFKIHEVNGSDAYTAVPGVHNKITGWQRRTGDSIGDTVCLTRRTTEGVSCGRLDGLTFNATLSDSFGRSTTLTELRRASYASQTGDSGGGIYNGIALGVHSGRSADNNWGLYNQIENVIDVLGIERIRVE